MKSDIIKEQLNKVFGRLTRLFLQKMDGMVQKRYEHKKPIIRAFVALYGETRTGA